MKEELVSFTVRIPESLHRQVKYWALFTDVSSQEFATEALSSLVEDYENGDWETPDTSEE